MPLRNHQRSAVCDVRPAIVPRVGSGVEAHTIWIDNPSSREIALKSPDNVGTVAGGFAHHVQQRPRAL